MATRTIISFSLTVAIFVWSCSQSPSSEKTESKTNSNDINVLSALPSEIPFPNDNPITTDKVKLGKLLFFDPILSGNKDVACATCHHPEFNFAESLEISIGVNGKGFGSKRDFNFPNDIPFVKRNSQSILNTAYNGINNQGKTNPKKAQMFWDLRTESLEKQSLEPIKAFEEMRGHSYQEKEALGKVIGRLKQIKE